MTLGEIIKNYRDDHDMSMGAFADKSGISKAYISLLEKNQHPTTGKPIAPSIRCIRQAAAGMNMDFDDLFAALEGDVSITESVELTDHEQNLVNNYRQLDPYDRGKVDGYVESLVTEKREKNEEGMEDLCG